MLVEPTQLGNFIQNNTHSLLIDVTSARSYSKHHIPGAIYFEYQNLIRGIPPAPGLLPEISTLSQALAAAGITGKRPVIAYDDEGGARASRLLWTLDLLGFEKLHLINGGLHAFAQAGLELEAMPHAVASTEVEPLDYNPDKIADKAFILANLDNPDVVIWDVRSEEEYSGSKPKALCNGHIPGAVNLNWLHTIDIQNGLRYLPQQQLIERLHHNGITPDKTIIPHCHTHHRSAHSTILLKHLGYQNVKAYPGSWSEWGNSTDTPIEN